jgi:hypothetical protein
MLVGLLIFAVAPQAFALVAGPRKITQLHGKGCAVRPTKLMSESTESLSVPVAPTTDDARASGLPLGSKFEQIVAEQGMVVA